MTAPDIAPGSDTIDGDDAPRVEINFPGFDVFKARNQQNGKLLRGPADKTSDYAWIRDVHNVALYAADCAARAVDAYNSALHPLYMNRLQSLANTMAWAIAESIDEYDHQRRHRAWWRRAIRWVRRRPFPQRRPSIVSASTTSSDETTRAAVADASSPHPPAEGA